MCFFSCFKNALYSKPFPPSLLVEGNRPEPVDGLEIEVRLHASRAGLEQQPGEQRHQRLWDHVHAVKQVRVPIQTAAPHPAISQGKKKKSILQLNDRFESRRFLGFAKK